jgi:STE24 endopeptidase
MEDKTKIKKYSSIKNRLHFIGLAFNLIILFIIIASGLSGELRDFLNHSLSNYYLQLICFYAIFSLALFIIGLPLDYYDGYTIEDRFNLSTQSKTDWFKDALKKLGVSLLIGLILILALYYLIKNIYGYWWVLAALFYFIFSYLLAKLMPVILLPLFYKQKELENKELKDRLLHLAHKTGQKISNVYEINLSKETKKANAALVGSGSTRRILLSDTLLKEYTDDEIEVILAHELAHHALRHMRYILAFGAIISLGIFFIVAKMLDASVSHYILASPYDIAGLPLIILLFSSLNLLISPLQNAFIRKLETDADKYALKLTGLNKAFISAMEKLTIQNLSDPDPSKFIKIMLYDHPPVSKRIELADSLKGGSTCQMKKP